MLSCGLLLASANAYRASFCRVLSRGLFLPSANAYRASFCRVLSRGLFLPSANAYRALCVVIVLSCVVSWSVSCSSGFSDKASRSSFSRSPTSL